MMVRAKKHLGQHFLRETHYAQELARRLEGKDCEGILEVGPGTGVLTHFLLQKELPLWATEIDRESILYLTEHFPQLGNRLLPADFLQLDLDRHLPSSFALVGNFPYHISNQIVFRMLEYRERIPEMVGMFQKEVAERLVAGPGSKRYGILSVWLALFYRGEYCFTVPPEAFTPPPKVQSAVVRFLRRDQVVLPCSDAALRRILKTAFNQRRKTLRNALKPLNLPPEALSPEEWGLRAEQLPPQTFVALAQKIPQ